MELMDDIKVMQDEIEEEKEDVRKGDLEPEEKAPEHEIDDLPPALEPTKEELGRFQKVGVCRCCQASIYVEEYRASKVVRPTLIYTCDKDYCWAGYDERDVLWEPKFFGIMDLKGIGEKDEPIRNS